MLQISIKEGEGNECIIITKHLCSLRTAGCLNVQMFTSGEAVASVLSWVYEWMHFSSESSGYW